MKKKTVVIAVSAWLALFGCFHVYGYWVERMEASCELSFAFPLQVEIQGREEEDREEAVYPSASPSENQGGELGDPSEATKGDAGDGGEAHSAGADPDIGGESSGDAEDTGGQE